MFQLRAFFSILRWDLALELRRKESTLNMCLFAVLMLFIVSYGVSVQNELAARVGPIFYWVAITFAGTVGLSRAFAVEVENGALQAILVAPVDAGVLYLAKVVATWIYVMIMSLLVLAAYVVLFDFQKWNELGELLAVTAAFCLAYAAVGTLLAAMTTGLKGGEVILRILLFPLMVPAIITALAANARIFNRPEFFLEAEWEALNMSPWICAAALLAVAAVYLASCFALFAKVVEE